MLKLIFIVFVFNLCNSEPLLRLRGVPLSLMSLYSPSKPFTCLDGSKTIHFTQVNDDYCDCLGDGSDEPGTNACPHGRFYCENEGYYSKDIPSSWVNDGICDCCDGTDEYATNTFCENTCKDMEQQEIEDIKRRLQRNIIGRKTRSELIQKGTEIKKEKEHRLKELLKLKSEAQLIKKEKLEAKRTAEQRERILKDRYDGKEDEILKERSMRLDKHEKKVNQAKEIFLSYDKNYDERLDVNEMRRIKALDANNDGYVTRKEILETFDIDEPIIHFNHFYGFWLGNRSLFNVSGEDQSMEQNSSTVKFLETVLENESVSDLKTELNNTSVMIDDDAKDEENFFEAIDQERIYNAEDDDVKERTTEMKYDEQMSNAIKEATEARAAFAEVERKIQDISFEIKDIEISLTFPYGSENEFLYMAGECYDYNDREFVYNLCPFDKVTQRSTGSKIERRLGSWSNWERDKNEVMVFSEGDRCWNGPRRQTRVKLVCGWETKVITVSEPNRCEYIIEFMTPAVCTSQDTNAFSKNMKYYEFIKDFPDYDDDTYEFPKNMKYDDDDTNEFPKKKKYDDDTKEFPKKKKYDEF